MDDYENATSLFTLEFSFITYHHSCNVNFVHITYLHSMDIYVYLSSLFLFMIILGGCGCLSWILLAPLIFVSLCLKFWFSKALKFYIFSSFASQVDLFELPFFHVVVFRCPPWFLFIETPCLLFFKWIFLNFHFFHTKTFRLGCPLWFLVAEVFHLLLFKQVFLNFHCFTYLFLGVHCNFLRLKFLTFYFSRKSF